MTRTNDGYYLNPNNTTSTAVSNSRGLGIVVGFAPGTVLAQLASSSPTGGRAYRQLLVHGATQSLSAAQASANAADPTQRLIYVGGQTLAPGGGAIELTIPTGSWVMYGYQWPEASRANISTNAIVLRQNGVEVPRIMVYRTDGTNGDTGFSPTFPFKMRGSVDPYTGLPAMISGEGNVSNLTYAISVPVVTNANFDILVRSDASCSNTLVKLDGGIDLNSQMGLGPTNNSSGLAPTNFLDLRDNKPGYATDVFLGYEQTAFQFRNGPEKFAAKNTLSNTIVSLGAETYYYTVGGGSNIVSGSGFGQSVGTDCGLGLSRPERHEHCGVAQQFRHAARAVKPGQRPVGGHLCEGRLPVSNQQLLYLLHHRRFKSRRRVRRRQRDDAGDARKLGQPRQRGQHD